MRKWWIRIGVVVGLGLLVWALRLTVFAPRPIEVAVVHPERGRVEHTVSNTKAGTLMARRRARLSPEVGGRVVELPVREGDRVEAGQVLLRLDDSVLRAQLEQARRELVTVEARHREACLAAEQAERENERYRSPEMRQIVSANTLDQLSAKAETSRAGCVAAAAAVDGAGAAIRVVDEQLAKLVLHSPFAGVVADVAAELGEWVTPSPPALPVPPVVEILDASSIYVSAPMDEVDSARVRAGLPARVTIDSHPGRSFAATVSRVAPYVLDVEAQNRTVEIEVDLDDVSDSELLLPGTSADVEVILEVHDDVWRIPTSTLLQGDAVLVVGPQVLERRPVEIGLRNWDWTEIRSGLGADDRVVSTLDQVEVQAGARVVVRGDGAAGEAAER
jgi:HlyD family secretion protein